MFRNVRAPGCSIGQNFFHRKNKACPEAFRRKMIGYVRSTLKESNGRLIASPLFALHVCQLGGAFSTTYKQDGDLTVIEDPCPDNSKYTLTTPGVQFCWKARIQLINRCVRTRDPMVSVQSGITNKRGVDLCAQKFKRMLDTSVPKRSTTWNAFSDRERDMIMPEAVLPFAMKKKETWCAFVLLYFFIFFERQIFLSLSLTPPISFPFLLFSPLPCSPVTFFLYPFRLFYFLPPSLLFHPYRCGSRYTHSTSRHRDINEFHVNICVKENERRHRRQRRRNIIEIVRFIHRSWSVDCCSTDRVTTLVRCCN